MFRTVDMRYRRQTHDIVVPFPAGKVTGDSIVAAVELFEKTYEALYGKGSGFRQAGIELTTFRVEGLGRTRKPVPHHPAATARADPDSRAPSSIPPPMPGSKRRSGNGRTCRSASACQARR